MLIEILTSIVCFGVAIVMFTKPMREFPYYQAISFYFLFEGAWELVNGVVLKIWPSSNFMDWLHCIGIIIFSLYLLYSIYYHSFKNKNN